MAAQPTRTTLATSRIFASTSVVLESKGAVGSAMKGRGPERKPGNLLVGQEGAEVGVAVEEPAQEPQGRPMDRSAITPASAKNEDAYDRVGAQASVSRK